MLARGHRQRHQSLAASGRRCRRLPTSHRSSWRSVSVPGEGAGGWTLPGRSRTLRHPRSPDGAFDVVLVRRSARCSRPTTRQRPASCCGCAVPAGRSRWRTGRPTARWVATSPFSTATPPTRPDANGLGDPAYATRLLAPAAVTTRRSHVRLAFTGTPAELVAYYRAHFPPVITTFAALDDAQAAVLEAELVTLFEGGYELEYLMVLAVTPRPDAPPAASTGRSG